MLFTTVLHYNKKHKGICENETKLTLPKKKAKERHQGIKLLDVSYCTRVYFLMFGQVIVAYESFPTLDTLIALVVMVDSEVEPVQKTVCSLAHLY